MYAKKLFLPPACSHGVGDFLEKIVLPLHESGSLDIPRMLVKRNYACLLVNIGRATVLVHYTPGEVGIASGSEQALRHLLRLLLRKLSELCKQSRSPELLLVFVGDSSVPDTEGKAAAILTRSGVRAAIFSALFIVLHWFLSAVVRADFSLSVLLSLCLVTFAATLISPFLILRAIPRWKIPRGQKVRVYKVVLERLDDRVYTSALLAKASISKHPVARLDVNEVRRTLEEWGVPVREVRLLEFDLNTMLGDDERIALYITSVPEITALSLGFSRRYSNIVLNAELLVDLEPEELSAVIEHELEHFRRKDAIFLSLTLVMGLAPLAFAQQLAVQASALAAYLVSFSAFLILLCRAIETRADLAAAARKSAQSLKRAVVKLEYSELLRSMSLSSKVLSVLNPSPQPPAWLRIAILERYAEGGCSLLKAFLYNALALKLAVEFDSTGGFKSCVLWSQYFRSTSLANRSS